MDLRGSAFELRRIIQIYEGDAVRGRALVELLRGIVANNRAGGWRHLRKQDL